jgi:hypothetical protein
MQAGMVFEVVDIEIVFNTRGANEDHGLVGGFINKPALVGPERIVVIIGDLNSLVSQIKFPGKGRQEGQQNGKNPSFD